MQSSAPAFAEATGSVKKLLLGMVTRLSSRVCSWTDRSPRWVTSP